MQAVGNGGDHNYQEEKREHDLHQYQFDQDRRHGRNIAVTDGGGSNKAEINRLQVAEVVTAGKYHLATWFVSSIYE